MRKTAAELMMERETRVAYGPVPRRLLEAELPEMSWQFRGKEFLLRALGDHYFYYRPNEGIVIERGHCVDPTGEALWLNGSIYSAIASINGLVPIHASAVVVNGSVVAFTGPAGAGKSTLVAALGDRGLPMFCDDTLVLDLSGSDQITCLPGHKRLKLKSDALQLTGAKPEEKVSVIVDKHYSQPASGTATSAMPLGELIFLEEGARPRITAITGAERFTRVVDDHYTADLYAGAQGFGPRDHFEHFAALASRTKMSSFVRPCDASRFGEGLDLLMNYLGSNPVERADEDQR